MIQYDEIKKEPQDESKIEEEVVKDQGLQMKIISFCVFVLKFSPIFR